MVSRGREAAGAKETEEPEETCKKLQIAKTKHTVDIV